MSLAAKGLTVRYPGGAEPAVRGVDFTATSGECVAIVGPNGCGKTTLIRALLGLLPVEQGSVLLENRPIGEWKRDELARTVALVPQREDTPFSWTVEEMVGFGRYARLGPLSPLAETDHAAIARAMNRCDVSAFRHRRIEHLSGGEWQRVRIARALAQEPKFLVLDEPTASLDLGHEMELFELVAGLVREGLAAIVVTHHLNIAARYAGRMVLLDQGLVVASGTPADVMRPERLSAVFHWPVGILTVDGGPHIVPARPGAR